MVDVPEAGRKGRRKIDGELVSPCEILGPSVVDLVRAGMRPSKAGEAVGLSRNTVLGWINRGVTEQARIEKGEEPLPLEEPYLKFSQDLSKAEAESQAGLVLAWFKEARQGDWKAAQAFLAKRFPEEWGDSNTLRLEVTGSNGGPIQAVHHVQQEDEAKKRAVLQALVESGDLPENVLDAWDGAIEGEVIYDSEEPVGNADGLEKALRNQLTARPTPEADSVPDVEHD
jgi:hypothetical protein